MIRSAQAQSVQTHASFGSLKQIDAGVLSVGYAEAEPQYDDLEKRRKKPRRPLPKQYSMWTLRKVAPTSKKQREGFEPPSDRCGKRA
jgi:hypothetical protein